jgi:alanyl-tRNA synthetase
VTERLYYTDSYLRNFDARVVESADDGRIVYLDRTAFYPTSGGQPHDHGTIAGVQVADVIDEGERIAHRTDAPVHAVQAACAIDWARRFDHMQQHSGQHLLSAAFIELYGLVTVSFHMGQDYSTIDLETLAVDAGKIAAVERRANELVFENRPIAVSFHESGGALDLRKPSEREGTLRVVSIDGLDRSACGGTHLHSTGEIGPVLIRKLEKVRNTVRVEFLCGQRAVQRARADFEALSRVAQIFSAALDDVPAVVAEQAETARDADKQRRKLIAELAQYQGRELYDATAPAADGTRRAARRLASGNLEDLRGLAQSFTAQPKAVFMGVVENPPSVLLAASADAGVDAGKLLKSVLTEAGGRGGGTARMAQGSVPSKELLEKVIGSIL